MDRNKFIKSCALACMGGGVVSALLQNCVGTKIISASIDGSRLVVSESEFEIIKKEKVQYLNYLIVQNDRLQFPICVYRLGDGTYSALWMKCTHQGTELQAFGDKLQCPAHGSEFNRTGGVESGPAIDPLRTFPVSVEDHQIKISLA